jgi:hypothetical protein
MMPSSSLTWGDASCRIICHGFTGYSTNSFIHVFRGRRDKMSPATLYALVDHHVQVIVFVDEVHYRREKEINGKLLFPYNIDTDCIP